MGLPETPIHTNPYKYRQLNNLDSGLVNLPGGRIELREGNEHARTGIHGRDSRQCSTGVAGAGAPVSTRSIYLRQQGHATGTRSRVVASVDNRQWRVIRVLTRGNTRILTRCCPALMCRYFSLDLAVSLPKQTRRETLLHHYQFLASRTNARFFSSICNRNIVLWQKPIGDNKCVIHLAFTELVSRYIRLRSQTFPAISSELPLPM